MATRSNACSELVRFWLEARLGCFIQESLPVPVPYGWSDIDFVALEPAGKSVQLPNERVISARFIVETKDEHDFDPQGKAFGTYLQNDLTSLDATGVIPIGSTAKSKFTMLRAQHWDVAARIFGTTDFDRLFVVHAIDPGVLASSAEILAQHRIHWLTIREVITDLRDWYRLHPRPTALRNSLVGDLWHLLVGYCGLDL